MAIKSIVHRNPFFFSLIVMTQALRDHEAPLLLTNECDVF